MSIFSLFMMCHNCFAFILLYLLFSSQLLFSKIEEVLFECAIEHVYLLVILVSAKKFWLVRLESKLNRNNRESISSIPQIS